MHDRMQGIIVVATLGCCLLAGHVSSQDVTCTSGVESFNVVLNPGDSFQLSTAGRRYQPNMDCSATYKLGEGCDTAIVDCYKFKTQGNKWCTKGDLFTIDADILGSETFCRKNGPWDYEVYGDFQIHFTSNGKKQRPGFECTVSCSSDGSGSGSGGSEKDCICGLAKRSNRIVGGHETEEYEYPWQVGLAVNGELYGGAVISDQWVLTAANIKPTIDSTVILGGWDQNSPASIIVKPEAVVQHPLYDPSNHNYDFSLLKLPTPVNFTAFPNIRPICLPVDDSESYEGYNATVTGWGDVYPGGGVGPANGRLHEVEVKVLSNAACKSSSYPAGQITDQMLCAGAEDGGKDACHSDDGGPLFTIKHDSPLKNYEHIGVVSSRKDGCGQAGYPGIYARTTAQLAWIQSTTSGTFTTCPRE